MRASQAELDVMRAVPVKKLLAQEPKLTNAGIAKRLHLNIYQVRRVRHYGLGEKRRHRGKPADGLAILEMLQAGRSNKEIASALHCSMSTIQKVVKDAEMVRKRGGGKTFHGSQNC
jgi:hypothetical protein